MRFKGLRKVRKSVLAAFAFITCLVMGISICYGQSAFVYAQENSVSDASTALGYQDTYNNKSTQYAGRIWTDKSVGTSATYGSKEFSIDTEKDEAFLVTFSALSSAQTIKSATASPIDVVFVLDFSASMTWGVNSTSISKKDGSDSRIQYLIDSLNTTIDTLVNANENNRIGIVTFNRVGQEFMAFTSAQEIKKITDNGTEYLTLEKFEEKVDENGKPTGDGVATIKNNINGQTRTTDSKTNIQYGLNQAMQMLMEESETTVTIDEQTIQRIPNVVLMSDGAPTTILYKGGENQEWWKDLPDDQEDSIGWGDNDRAWSANGILPMMTASYMKNVVTDHYFKTNPNQEQMNIYTIGFSTNQQTEQMVELANLVLNPKDNLETAASSKVEEIQTIAHAWKEYQDGKKTQVHYVTKSNRAKHNYRLNHPENDDITTLEYNTAYYPATNSDQLDEAFEAITNSMVDQGKAPTEVTGGLTNSGYITYTDTIGDYMELKDVKGLVIGSHFFEGKYDKDTNSITLDTTKDVFENNIYGKQNVGNLQITLSEKEDKQVLTVKIPASLIPIVHDIVELDVDGEILDHKEDTMYPMRLVYSVGLKDHVLQSDGNIDYSNVSDAYIEKHTDKEGNILFYSNYYDGTNKSLKGQSAGNTFVEYEPAHDNSYYFLQENTPIYLDSDGNQQAESFSTNQTYYVPFTYYDHGKKVTTYEARLGSVMADYVGEATTGYYLKEGAPRLGNIANFTQTKQSATATAKTYYAPTFHYRGSTDNAQEGYFHVYLGNNGVIKVPTASLTITKEVTADSSLTAPDKDFTFKITSQAKENETVLAQMITGEQEKTKEVTFDEHGVATITLKDNQSMKLLGMANADYEIQEVNIPSGFAIEEITGADKLANENIASGTVNPQESVKFTNNYSVTSITSTDLKLPFSSIKTIKGRDFQKGDTFTFSIKAAQATPNAPLPKDEDGNEQTEVTISPSNGDTANFSFGEITFTNPGEYRYIIQENIPTEEKLPGVNYDSAIYRVNVVIKDNGDGTLALANPNEITNTQGNLVYNENPFIQKYVNGSFEEDPVSTIEFINEYDAKAAKISLQGTKILETTDSDHKLKDDEFSFVIEGLGSNKDGGDVFEVDSTQPMPLTEDGIVRDTAKNIANGNVNFGEMTFTQDMVGKTFGYKITEVLPEGVTVQDPTLDGMTYDSSEKIVKVTVEDDGQGNVVAKVTPSENTSGNINNFTFTNTYEPSSVAIGNDTIAGIQVQKTLTGRDWNEEDAFSFTLTGEKNAPMPEGAKEGKKQITILGSDASKTKDFGEITYDKAGIYTYTIQENLPEGVSSVDPSLSGITYDTHISNVTVTVTDTNGQLQADVTYDDGSIASFTNTYTANTFIGVPERFSFSKNLVGRDWAESDVFTFTLTGEADAPMPECSTGQTKTINVTKDNVDSFNFGYITYTTPGTYTYTVSENQPENTNGIQYDTHTAKVVVVVSDNGNGQLCAVAQTHENTVFMNTYSADADYNAFGALTIQKNMIGKSIDANEFKFTITAQDKDSIQKAGKEVTEITVPEQDKANGDGSYTAKAIVFNSMTFDQDDIGKTFTYTVKEVVDDAGKLGYTYDKKEHTVKISVDKNEDGSLYVTTLVDGQSFESNAVVVFHNRYDASATMGDGDGSVKIQATKRLEGRDMAASEFNFVVYNTKDPSKTPVSKGSNQAASDGQAADIDFTSISYTTEQMNQDVVNGLATKVDNTYTYTYNVEEALPSLGVSAVESSFTIQVQVEDQKDGTLSISVVYPEDMDSLEFVNVYGQNAKAFLEMKGTKVLNASQGANVPDITGKYQFTITNDEGAPMPAVTTVTNDASGNVDFGMIEYTIENVFGNQTQSDLSLEQAVRSKTFTYTITETGSLPGVINDANIKTVVVTVSDLGDGTLRVESSPAQGPKFTFVNTYQTTTVTSSPTDTSISITKELEGQKLDEGEFTFQMKDTDGNVVSGAANDADGNVVFAGITFETPGTYNYTISELNTGINGFTYDTSVYEAVATVTDQQDGTLKVEWSVTKDQKAVDSIVFKNTYAPVSSANVQLGAIKKLEGKELSDGQFAFELKDEEGKVISKATNDEQGRINFEPIDFDEAGSYSYTLEEVNDGQKGIQYDESIYDISIDVEDDQQGHLVVTTCDITKDGEAQEAIIFTNEYQENEQPGNGGQEDPGQNTDGSDTAAKTGAGLFIRLIGSAVSLMGLLLAWRKRA